MNDGLTFAWSFVVGALLGGVFFGGLWWTVRRGVSADHPALWFLGSLLFRTAVTLAGFYLVGVGHWPRLVPCILGFVVAQLLVTWRTRSLQHAPHRTTRETRRAP